MKSGKISRAVVLTSLAVAVAQATTVNAVAQEARTATAAQPARDGRSISILEEITVSARKRAESAQDVPIAIVALSSDQIEALKIRGLTDMAVGMPNVTLDELGTFKATANFSIRGLGVNSSIPSIEPTVGLFVNGVYLALNNGVVFDTFDLETIEVLRGPQGVLFGRNVTGGAILMSTKKPGDEFEGSVRLAIDGGGDGGQNYFAMGSVGGPLSETVGLRLSTYYNDDSGWFKNLFNGEDYGAMRQVMVRPTLLWKPADRSELVVRYEYSDIETDGSTGKAILNYLESTGQAVPPPNTVRFSRNSFDVSNDFMGFQTVETHFVSTQFDQGVDFGDGTVTAIYGYRKSSIENGSDIDSQPIQAFDIYNWVETEQNSLEIRFNGRFGPSNITVGGYWFSHDLDYGERRNLLGELTRQLSGGVVGSNVPFQILDGGALYDVDSVALFGAVDYELTDLLTLTVGLRWSDEEKSVSVATQALNRSVLNLPTTIASGTPTYSPDGRCNVVLFDDCPFDFDDSKSWSDWSPKLGLTYRLSGDAIVYGSLARGFRSGGYNLRSANPNFAPGPFDEETVDSAEVGYKANFDRGRLNTALFVTKVKDMQREVISVSPTAGVAQVVRNTADATIKGVEVEGAYRVTDNLLFTGSLGYMDSGYDSVKFDINADGIVDEKDKNLDIPRAPDLTYTVGLNYDFGVGSWGNGSARVSYSYRDEDAVSDDNKAIIDEQEVLDAGVEFYTHGERWILSLYAKNLLDSVKYGTIAQLPQSLGPLPLGGGYAPMTKGRVIGAQVEFRF